jgi:hypothetical protein
MRHQHIAMPRRFAATGPKIAKSQVPGGRFCGLKRIFLSVLMVFFEFLSLFCVILSFIFEFFLGFFEFF